MRVWTNLCILHLASSQYERDAYSSDNFERGDPLDTVLSSIDSINLGGVYLWFYEGTSGN